MTISGENLFLKKIGILGAGKMGQDILMLFLEKGFSTLLYTRDSAKAEKLTGKMMKRIDRSLKRGVIDPEDAERQRQSLCISTELSDAADCDLVIECIVEERGTKQELLQRIDTILPSGTFLASNSSSYLPRRLMYRREGERIISRPLFGIHFFYPVKYLSICELIIPRDNVPENHIIVLKELLNTLDRNTVILPEEQGYLFNTFLLPLQAEAAALSDMGIPCDEIDEVVLSLGFQEGIFSFFRKVGYPVLISAVNEYTGSGSSHLKYRKLLDILDCLKRDDPVCGKNENLPDLPWYPEFSLKTAFQGLIVTSLQEAISRTGRDAGDIIPLVEEYLGMDPGQLLAWPEDEKGQIRRFLGLDTLDQFYFQARISRNILELRS